MPQTFFTDSVTVEWAPGSDPFDETPTWTTLSNIWSVSTRRGRSGVFDLYAPGTCTIVVDNHSGSIDPTEWYRWRQVRVTATATGPTDNVLFRGFVTEILHDQSGRSGFATAQIQCMDLLGVVGRYSYTPGDGEAPEDIAGTRVARVANDIDVPNGWRAFSTGYINIAELEAGSYNALQHLQEIAQAEAGAIYVTGDGILTFEDRYEALNRLSSSPVTVFSDTYSGSEVPFLYGDVVLTPVGRDYRNRIVITPDSRTAQIDESVPAGYPPDSLSLTLPIADDAQAAVLASFLLDVYSFSTDVVWPLNLTTSVFTQTVLDEVSALELRDYCQVEFTPAATAQQTYDVFVESIDHTISDTEWQVRLGFSSAARWEEAWGEKDDYLIIGDASFGLIGTGKIGPH